MASDTSWEKESGHFFGSVFYNSGILGVIITNTSRDRRRANIKFTSVTESTPISSAPDQASVASLSQSGSIPWDWIGGGHREAVGGRRVGVVSPRRPCLG